MRKTVSALLIVALLLMPLPALAAATPHDVYVQIENEIIDFPDAKPFVDEEERVQVPARFLLERLGYTVEWAARGQAFTITLTNEQHQIEMSTDSSIAVLDGQPTDMGTAPVLKENRIFIPLRFIAELSGLIATWDGDNSLVILHQSGVQAEAAFSAPKWKVLDNVTATAYTAPRNEQGEFEARTYSGNVVDLGDVAVDPDVIPLGSTLYIEGYDFAGLPEGGMLGTATDIGGAVKGNKIDIFVPVPRKEALKFGYQTVKVYILEE